MRWKSYGGVSEPDTEADLHTYFQHEKRVNSKESKNNIVI